MSITVWPHIEIDPSGVAWIQGTRVKVVDVVMDHVRHHWDADEICREHPTIPLSSIHAALGMYCENLEEFDQVIAKQVRRDDELRERIGNSEVQAKLRRVCERIRHL